MENSLAVANYFIERSFQTGIELTPMKLIKMAYIAHGWHLAITGKPLINEAMQGRKYGPFIDSLYRTFRQYANGQILRMEYEYQGYQIIIPTVSEPAKRLLDKIWEVYGKHDGIYLGSITNHRDTPWGISWRASGGKKNKLIVIPNDLIQSHYKDKAIALVQYNASMK